MTDGTRKVKSIYKITKTWYVEAKDVMKLQKDKLLTSRRDADEIKISKVRDW